MVNIAEMNINDRGIITSLAFKEIPLPLINMGCMVGEEVVVIQKAPSGCPIYLAVDGNHFALRKADCSKIMIKPI